MGGLAAGLVSSCAVDEPFTLSDDWQDGTTLDILIPSTSLARRSGMTRADNPYSHSDGAAVAENEGKIKTLTIIAFYTGKDNAKHHFYREVNPEEGVATGEAYVKYAFYVEPGDYKVYVLGNINLGSSILSALKSDLQKDNPEEDDLEARVKNLAHLYVDDKGNYVAPTTTDGLPMATVVPKTVKENESNAITANMEFLCAKVRLSVIYDNAYGEKFQINDVTGSNLYPASFLFPDELKEGTTFSDEKYTTPLTSTDVMATSAHYTLSDDIQKATLSELAAIPESGEADKLDFSASDLLSLLPAESFVWQGVAYLPEYLGKSGSDRTTLTVNGKNDHSYEFKLGCEAGDSNYDGDGINLQRGHYYDIVAKVADSGEVTFAWDFMAWTPENLSVQLSGNTELYLGQTVIDSMTGEDVVEIAYSTTAPRLTFESQINEEYGVAYFILKQNTTDGTIQVSVNPNLPNGEYDDVYFWVYAGSIKKKVVVNIVRVSDYLRFLPAEQVVYISQIANETSHYIYFEFATNIDGLNLSIESVTNENTNKNNFTVAVCDLDENQTLIESFGVVSASQNFISSGKISDTNTTIKGGYIRFEIDNPTDVSSFSKEIVVNMKATATGDNGTLSETTKLRIIPNALKYTIHFKAVNGSVTDSDGNPTVLSQSNAAWDYPHIYVYQPLEYNGYPVYGNTKDKDYKINWLEYSFTGRLAFKGWVKDGGVVADITDRQVGSVKIAGNNYVQGYTLDSDWDDPGQADDYKNDNNKARYNSDINLLGNFETSCTKCESDIKTLWPGIGMQKEEDGWWKIELPMLAKPGKALVMFTASHDHDGKDANRYPTDGYPGIPLPNYADCEAWYLYDEALGGDNCSFSDDRRDSYPAAPVIPDITESIVLRAPKNSSDTYISSTLYIWDINGSKLLDAHPGTAASTSSDGNYYCWSFSYTHQQTVSINDLISGFLFTNGDSNTTNSDISWSGHHSEVTDATTKDLYGSPDRLFTIWATGNTEPQPGGGSSTDPTTSYKIVFRVFDPDITNPNLYHLDVWNTSGGRGYLDDKWPGLESTETIGKYRVWRCNTQTEKPTNLSGFILSNGSSSGQREHAWNSNYVVEETDANLLSTYNADCLYTLYMGKYYVVLWPTHRTSQSSDDKIYMWNSSETIFPFNNWNNKYSPQGYCSSYYNMPYNINWTPISQCGDGLYIDDSEFNYILIDSEGQSSDLNFNSTNVELTPYSNLNSDLKKIVDDNIGESDIRKIFRIKNYGKD